MIKQTTYLSHSYGKPNSWTLSAYESAGGYRGVRKALSMTREAVIEEAKKAHVRGRGGAGFDCGTKWSFMPKESKKPHYLVVNADEGEPGTFKDRSIMEMNPHSLIEGCIIGCYGIGAHACYIYVRDELHLSKERLWGAIKEAKAKGYLGKNPFGKDYEVEVYVHTGAGAYICGEETALLNSLEGRRGEPRLKPPFPAQYGAFGCPSTVNNVETLAIMPTAFEMGCDEFSKLSELHSFNDGGARLFGVSGHVKKPGIYEACVGLTLRELIYDLGGGVLEGRSILGVVPGGSSCPVHLPDEVPTLPADAKWDPYRGKSILDIPLGVDTFRNAGSMLGTCCAMVMSDAVDPVLALHNVMRFYRHESCGQCTPCREGCGWIERILNKIVEGKGSIAELDEIHEIANNITGNTICAFGDGAAQPALAFVRRYRKHFEDYIVRGGKVANAKAHAMTVGNVFFIVASVVALVGAIMTIASRSPIRSAVGLLITIVGIAALFLMLNAQFLAAIQLIVYAGAVVVLFVFVIMLLGPDAHDGEGTVARARVARYGAGAFFGLMAAAAAHLVTHAPDATFTRVGRVNPGHGSVEAIGTLLFGSEVIPFELATALLIVAVVGAIAVARGKPHVRRESKSASPTDRMFHGPLMARDAQRPLPTKAQKAAAKAAAGGV